MNIGIDIDNTITDTLPILKRYCKKYNDEEVKRNLVMHDEGFASYNLFDWTKEENMDFCIKYLEEVVLQANLKENAKEVIKKLKDEGHTINVISSRVAPMFKTPYETTEKYLKKHGIKYDNLLVGSINKKQISIENKIDVMIEDEPHYIEELSETIPVIVFDYEFNKICNGKNIIRVNNWNEIYDIIENLKNNNDTVCNNGFCKV